MADNESTELTVQDGSTLLEGDAFHRVAVHNGVTVLVDRRGRFSATAAGDVVLTDTSLDALKERIDRAATAELRRRKLKKAIRVFVVDEGRGFDGVPFVGYAFFTGYHGGNGDVLYKTPDGSNRRSSYATLIPADHPGCAVVMDLYNRKRLAAEVATQAARALTEALEVHQTALANHMEDAGVARSRYGRLAQVTVNSPETAVAATEALIPFLEGGG